MNKRIKRKECSEDKECESNLCINYKCTPSIGDECNETNECMHLGIDSKCVEGRCVIIPSKKIEITICENISDCEKGFFCSNIGLCKKRFKFGYSCPLDEIPGDVCEEGTVCINTEWLVQRTQGECLRKCNENKSCPFSIIGSKCNTCPKTKERFCTIFEERKAIPLICLMFASIIVFIYFFIRKISKKANEGRYFVYLPNSSM